MTFSDIYQISSSFLTNVYKYFDLIMQQAHGRAVETARSVSKITVNFYQTLDMHASKLTEIMEDAHAVNDEKLSEFEKKFEVSIVFLILTF